MIVKNEEKYLRRCLEAISPILREVPSELIIADTGSTDRTVEIAREFTDKVIHFEWCDDFGAARNSTLKKAKGAWYMYLDADEIVQDCTDLIRFFNTGEYLRYNSGVVTLKSFNDESQIVKATIHLTRLVKKQVDLKFINPIHERLNILKEPSKQLDLIIDHYGYVTKNNEEFIKTKIERNLKIMFAEEQKKPDDCLNLYNICQAYMLDKNMEAALNYCEKGIKFAKEQKLSFELLFYIRKAQIYFLLKDYQKLLVATEEYFSAKKVVWASDIEMYIYQARSYTFFNSTRDAIDAYKNFIKIYRGFEKGLYNTPDMHYSSVNYTELNSYVYFTLNLVELLLKTGDHEQAKAYSASLSLQSLLDHPESLMRKLQHDIEIMKISKDFSELPLVYDQLKAENQSAHQDMIEQLTGEEHVAAAKAFSDADIAETAYVKLMRLRSLFYCGTMTARDVEEVLSVIETGSQVYADLAYFTLYSNASVELLNNKFDAFDFAGMVNKERPCFQQWPVLSKTIVATGDDQTVKYLWMATLHELALVSDITGDDVKLSLFTEYGRHFGKYLHSILSNDIRTEQQAFLLPKALRTGFLSSLAIACRDSGGSAEYIRCLRAVLKTEPRLYGMIHMLFDEMTRAEQQKQQELQEYARLIKRNILTLCEKNETEKVMQIIAAYEELCPNDTEIIEIKRRLGTRQ
jgi:glycosyltransferase involved in cell wall biosynthesis